MSGPNTAASIYGSSDSCSPCAAGSNVKGILQVVEEGGGGDPAGNAQLDVITVATNGQTAFTLTQIPNDAPAARVFYNGAILLRNGANYSLSGTTLTLISVDWEVETGDTIHVAYTHD